MTTAMQMPKPGDRFHGKYELREVLGRGGFATIFLARDLEIQRDVAVKILAPNRGVYLGNMRARFMIEARAIAGLHDARTIRLFEFGEAESGLLFMVFQYVAGVDLAVLLKGAILGIPRYMSPEQVLSEPVGPASDIYSLGLTGFDILLGRPMVEGSEPDMVARHVSGEPFIVPQNVGSRPTRRVGERGALSAHLGLSSNGPVALRGPTLDLAVAETAWKFFQTHGRPLKPAH